MKIGNIVAHLLQVVMLLFALTALFTGSIGNALLGFLVLFLSIVPMIVERRLNVTFPWEINLLIVVSLFLHYGGEYQGWYDIFYPYYDKIAHLITSVTVALLGFLVVLLMERYAKTNFSAGMVFFMIIVLTMAMGAFWEIYEFTFDTAFGTDLQHGNTDTMIDLIFDLVGALIVAFFGTWYLKKNPRENVLNHYIGRDDPENIRREHQ